MKRLALALLFVAVPAAAESFDSIAGHTLAETAVRSRLRDPDSAQFSWPYGFRYGTFRVGRLSTDGWITCGITNAKNGFGGYVGGSATVVVIRDDRPVVALVDDPRLPLLAKTCAKMGMPL